MLWLRIIQFLDGTCPRCHLGGRASHLGWSCGKLQATKMGLQIHFCANTKMQIQKCISKYTSVQRPLWNLLNYALQHYILGVYEVKYTDYSVMIPISRWWRETLTLLFLKSGDGAIVFSAEHFLKSSTYNKWLARLRKWWVQLFYRYSQQYLAFVLGRSSHCIG